MPNAESNYVRLKGSEHKRAKGAQLAGPADPEENITVTLRVRRRPDAPPVPDHAHWVATPPGRRRFLSNEEFAARYGAAAEDFDIIARFAGDYGLAVGETNIGGRTVLLSGTLKAMSLAFGVELGRYESPEESYRGHEGFISVPEEIADIVVAVFGLDNRKMGYRNSNGDPPITGPQTTQSVAQLYNFPPVPAGITNQIIGIVEFGGGYAQADIGYFFSSLSLSHPPAPVEVDINGSNGSPEGEVTGDICVASSVAPGAKIQVYFGPVAPEAQDFFNVIDRIAHPKAGDPPMVTVLSISYSLVGADDDITPMGVYPSMLFNEMSSDFQDMAAKGVTVFAASGDGGSNGWNNESKADGKAHVAYPGSDPWVTSCGGTTIGYASSTATQPEEWVWNELSSSAGQQEATGGGVSVFFNSLPAWQEGVGIPPSINDPSGTTIGRGVPDVAGNASTVSGYALWVDAFGMDPGPNAFFQARARSLPFTQDSPH